MDDDKPDQPTVTPAPPPGKPRKRAPPTIDLKAASVSDSPSQDTSAESTSAPGEALNEQTAASPEQAETPPTAAANESAHMTRGVAPIVVAAMSGAVASCVVLGAAWFAMSPGGKSDLARVTQPQAAVKGDLDTLSSRIAKIEMRPASSAASAVDTTSAARIDTLEKSIASLRDDVASARTSIDAVKSAPRETAAPDLSAVEERIAKIERATVALTGEVAAPKPAEIKSPEEDPRLRLVAVATSLDTSVRQSEPYAATLSTARSLAGDVSVLKPLDAFADKGIPSVSALNNELLALLPQLAPKASAAAPTGFIDRLKQTALSLARIERVDDAATTATVARMTAAAQRGDLVAARREVEALSGGDRAQMASWIDKVSAREAALAASRQFASNAAAALPKSAQ